MCPPRGSGRVTPATTTTVSTPVPDAADTLMARGRAAAPVITVLVCEKAQLRAVARSQA